VRVVLAAPTEEFRILNGYSTVWTPPLRAMDKKKFSMRMSMTQTLQSDGLGAGYCNSGTEQVKSRRPRGVVMSENFMGLLGKRTVIYGSVVRNNCQHYWCFGDFGIRSVLTI
jgi:hypothetical protein